MRLKRVLFSFIAAGLIAGNAHAAVPTQFSSASGEIRDFVAVSASVGYAGTYGGGLWKSIDSGANWVKTSLPAKTVWKVSFNAASGGARLYAATDSGIWRSTDSGTSWTQLTQDITRAVAVSPGSAAGGPDTVLAGVTGVGVIRTTDSGATFTRVSSGLDSTDVTGLTYAPGSSTVAYVVLQCNVENVPSLSGQWGGVFRTTTATAGAPVWGAASTGLPPPSVGGTAACVSSIAANGTSVVAGILDPNTLQGNTYFITGSQVTGTFTGWTQSTSNVFGVEWLGPDISNANAYWLGSNQFGPHRSTDSGANFGAVTTAVADPDFVTKSLAAGAFTGTVWVAGINGIGLFRTTTGGGPWSLPNTPVRADRVNDLTSHTIGLPAVYYMAIANGSVMRSADSGASWAEFDAGLATSFAGTNSNFVRDAKAVGAHPNNGNVVGLGLRPFGLYQLTGGTSWAMVAGFSESADHKPQSIEISPGGKVYYSIFDARGGTPGGLYTSTTTGTTLGTLTAASVPLNNDAAGIGGGIATGSGRVRISPSQPESRAFLIVNDALPYLTTNGGGNWTRVITTDVGFQRHAFNDIAEKPGSASIVVGATNKGIYRSIDGGAHLSRVNATGLQQHQLAALVYATNNVLFGGDFNGQMYCSGDDGVTWLAVTGGNLGASIKHMKSLNGSIHVLTDGGGFWKKDGVCP